MRYFLLQDKKKTEKEILLREEQIKKVKKEKVAKVKKWVY